MEKEFKIVVVEPFEAQEESTTSATTDQSTDQTTSSTATTQDTTSQSTTDASTTTDQSTSDTTTQSTDQSTTDATTQDASSSDATTQSTSDTSTSDATTQSSTDATTQTTSWETLGTKTFSITAEEPSCGIKVVSWDVELLKNGSPISSGATVYTTDEISIKATFTVAPNGTGCVASGSVGISTQLDNNNPSISSQSISNLTSQQTYTVTKSLGTLSAGSHTITVTAQYIPGPIGA